MRAGPTTTQMATAFATAPAAPSARRAQLTRSTRFLSPFRAPASLARSAGAFRVIHPARNEMWTAMALSCSSSSCSLSTQSLTAEDTPEALAWHEVGLKRKCTNEHCSVRVRVLDEHRFLPGFICDVTNLTYVHIVRGMLHLFASRSA
jgi:hypothetical protein